jgi:hypothetical protein
MLAPRLFRDGGDEKAGHGDGDGDGHGLNGVKLWTIVELGGVLGSTRNMFGCRQRVEVHSLVKRVEALTTANNDYALAA